MNTFKYIMVSLLVSGTLLCSCMDADIEEAVAYEEYYLNLDDADAAVMGIYGKLMGLADRLVVLNELRGDLLDVTGNADESLVEINLQKASRDNDWADVTPVYELIQNCNDALFNFNKMREENKLTADEYKERYSDIGAVRCWLYYQLGVHFGKIPYITEPVVSMEDALKQRNNLKDLDALIPELIRFMEQLPTLEKYQNSKLISGMVDNHNLTPFFINKKCLLGDLYLFNNQYDDAATIYREVLSANEDADDTNNNRMYRLYSDVWTGGEVNTFFAILFHRFKPDDLNLYYNAWVNMFKGDADDRYVREEMIWEMTYDYKFAPNYPFIELFGTEAKGKYYLKPSTYAIEEMWGAEQQKNGYPYDLRGISGGVAQDAAGNYTVAKYSLNYDPVESPFEQEGKWYLYRAALLHLRFAEAANRSESGGGYPRLAWALVNDGIHGSAFRWTNESGAVCRGDSIYISSFGPADPYPAPYYFDGRMNDQPRFRSPWRSNAGIRGRANLPNVDLSHIANKQDSIRFVEEMIVREAGLELAFEGHRWTDLIRIARRLQKIDGTGGQFLHDKMRRKYELAGLPVPDFSSESSWYLPLYD